MLSRCIFITEMLSTEKEQYSLSFTLFFGVIVSTFHNLKPSGAKDTNKAFLNLY